MSVLMLYEYSLSIHLPTTFVNTIQFEINLNLK